jgi:hypothetical protein
MTKPRPFNKPYRPFSGYVPDGVLSTNGVDNGFPFSNSSFDPLHKDIDLQWAGRSKDDKNFNSYYDYYFSGEDVKVYIDGLFGPGDELEIASFAFTIKQEKQPLYGFWSYNFDAVMYGSRIIAGNMSIISRYPRRMTELLEKAAKIRTESVGQRPSEHVRTLLSDSAEGLNSEDEKNIQKYWSRSQLDRITNDPANSGQYESFNSNIFSVHPPFNIIIYYGVQENGLTTKGAQQSSNNFNPIDNYDRILSTDYNTRLTKVNNQKTPMKIVLQSVQLMSMSTGYDTTGSPIQEGYEFIARDMYFTIADDSTNPLANLVQEQPVSGQSTDSSSNTQTSGGGGSGAGLPAR